MRDKQIQQKIVQAFDNAAPEIPGVAPTSRGTWEEPIPSRRASHPVLRWAMVAAAAVLVFFCGFAVVHAWKASPSADTVHAAAFLPTATAVPVITSAPDPVQMSVKQPPATTAAAPTQSPAPTATVLERGEVRRIILSHAEVAAESVQQWYMELDRENGRPVYEVEFTANSAEYEYEIDAITGEILKSERELLQPILREDAPAVATTPGDIGRDEALSIALQHAGVQAEQAQRIRVETDRENGRAVYDVEFTADGNEYEYEVDAATGEILKSEREKAASSSKSGRSTAKSTSRSTAKATARPTAKATAKPTSKPTDASTTKSIGRDEALSIALKNAGIKSSQAKKVKVEKDRENGRTIYEVEFTADGYEYEYEIDASSGKILKKEKERDDD